MKRFAVIFILALISERIPAAPTDEADRAALIKDVKEIDTNGIPGGLCVFGPEALAVIAGKEGDGLLPIVAAARWEKGRIVALGHDGFLRTPNERDTGKLLLNAARWAAGDVTKPRIGVLNMKNPALLELLKQNNFDVVPLGWRTDWKSKLSGISVICIAPLSIGNADIAPLETFIRSGGGLVCGETGWGAQKYAKNLATNFPGNLLLKQAGLIYTTAKPGRTLSNAYSTDGDLTLLNAGAALVAAADHDLGKTPLTSKQLKQCGTTLVQAVKSLPPDDRIILPKIALVANQPAKFPKLNALLGADTREDGFRIWTEEITRRQIEAEIIEKDETAGTVTLRLKNMSVVKMEVLKLTTEDRNYIKEWVKEISPQDQLTVRIIASGISRGKRVEVDVKAGKSDVRVRGNNLDANVKAGGRKLFPVEVPDNYQFRLTDSNGNLIDEETAFRKTGKTESR